MTPPNFNKTPMYVPTYEGKRLWHIGLYSSKRKAKAQGNSFEADKVLVAVLEKR